MESNMKKKVLSSLLIIALMNLTFGCKIMDVETVTSYQIADGSELIRSVNLNNGEKLIFDENGGKLRVLEHAIEGNTRRGFKRLPLSSITKLEWKNSLSPASSFYGSSNDFLTYITANSELSTQNTLVKKAHINNIEFVFDTSGGKYTEKKIHITGYTSNGSFVDIDKSSVLSAELEKISAPLSIVATIGLVVVFAGVGFLFVGPRGKFSLGRNVR
jgi:hypothetical protein